MQTHIQSVIRKFIKRTNTRTIPLQLYFFHAYLCVELDCKLLCSNVAELTVVI